MTKVFCDKCGVETKNKVPVVLEVEGVRANVDFCSKCVGELKNSIDSKLWLAISYLRGGV